MKDLLAYEPVPLQQVVKYNPYYAASVPEHPKRAEFFARYQTEPLDKLIPSLLGEKPLPLRLLQALWRKIARKLHFH